MTSSSSTPSNPRITPPTDTYYEDDYNNGSFDDNGWQTEESSQPENSAIWAQLLELMVNTCQIQKDQADALITLQNSLEQFEKNRECLPPSPEPEANDFDTNDMVCEPASPENVMEGHAPWESQETTERVEDVVEEEVVDNLVNEDVEEEAVSDSTNPSPTISENFENFEHFQSKDLVMSESVPSPDKTSRSLLVPIHLLDDDQEDVADELVFENNKHDFFGTHDPFMNGKLDVINTFDGDILKHPDMLPSDPIRLKNFYWYCRPKPQNADDTQYASNNNYWSGTGHASHQTCDLEEMFKEGSSLEVQSYFQAFAGNNRKTATVQQ
ncbi:hypothetical protein L2E82_51666 [Cichorium intybus]|nr:hypothetical protein L2E82_51666 [Cichorium intybus]